MSSKKITKDIEVSIKERKAIQFLTFEKEAKLWVEDMINETLAGDTAGFIDTIRDGVILCRVANVFAEGVIKKIHKVRTNSVLQFVAIDNISQFFKACDFVGFPKTFMFSVPDLWDGKNIVNVVFCVHALAHFLIRTKQSTVKLRKITGKVQFDEDEIKKTKQQLEELEDDSTQNSSSLVDKFQAVNVFQDDKEDLDGGSSEESESDLEDLADPDECLIQGKGKDGSVAGEECTFTIVAKDTIGNRIEVGGEIFSVVLFNKKDEKIKITPKVKDKEDGTYIVSYTPTISGDYSMEIYLQDSVDEDDDDDKGNEDEDDIDEDDEDEGEKKKEKKEEKNDDDKLLLKGFPSIVKITPAPISDPLKSKLNGIGLEATTADTKTTFNLTTFDKFGNKGSGGEDYECTVEKVKKDGTLDKEYKIKTDVLDNKDGSYEFSYICNRSGKYKVGVYLKDKIISEKEITVKDTGISEPVECLLEDSKEIKEKSLTAGEKFTFCVTAKDKNGNLRESGGELFTAVLENQTTKNKVSVPVDDTHDGKYRGEYTPTTRGDYKLIVKVNNKEIKDDLKFTLNDSGNIDPSKCMYILDESSLKNIRAGETQKLVVVSKDKYGNEMEKGGKNIIVRVTSKEVLEEVDQKLLSVKDLKNGKYEIEYSLKEAGGYAIEVLVKDDKGNDTNISGFPKDCICIESGKTDSKRCKLEGDGLEKAISKKGSSFTVTTFDQFGNLRNSGGDKLEVELINDKRKVSFKGEVTDHEDGTYEVIYLPDTVGDFRFSIIVNGEETMKEIKTVKVNAPSAKELSENEIFLLQDHDLLSSLVKTMNEEETGSLINEIQALREKLIGQIRNNFDAEKSVLAIEKKIELLIDNRIELESLLQDRGLFSKFRKKKKNDTKKVKKELENITLYSNMFYLLQTQPKYLSRCLYMVPTEKVDSFLETTILTLYGYAFSAREEYLILNLFKQSLELEVERDNVKVGSFLNTNPVLPKMVMTYGRRLQGKQYLQKVLFDKIIKPIISVRGLNLDLNAVKILKKYISDKEVETGERNTKIDVKFLTYEIAMKEPHIKDLITERLEKLKSIVKNVLTTMTDNVNDMPYGLRYVCKQLNELLLKKHPKSSGTERASVIGYIVYYRFMNPALVSPEAFELTKKMINAEMRRNLILVSKVMTNLTNIAVFDKNLESHMVCMNGWLRENEKNYVGFIQKLINVSDPEDSLGVDEYMELTQKSNPTITIKWNEIFSTHSLLLKYRHKLAPNADDPLNKILNEVGMDVAPQEVPQGENEEIKLPLINKFTVESSPSDKATPNQIYEQSKESFRKILKNIPPEKLGSSIVSTLKNASQFAKLTLSSNKNDRDSKLILACVNQIENALPILEKANKVTRKTDYREMLVDITKDLKNLKLIRKKQQKEYEKLKESLISLQQHQKYLDEKISDFEEYISDSTAKTFTSPAKGKKKKKAKKYKFSYSQLKKKGVIKQMSVMKAQRNRVKFLISMPSPGKFVVDAKIANLTVKTIGINLDDLLSKKARGVDTLDYEYVQLDVNMTLHVMNKLFIIKNK